MPLYLLTQDSLLHSYVTGAACPAAYCTEHACGKTGTQAIQQHRLRIVTKGSSRRSCLRLSFHDSGKHSFATSVSLSLRPEQVG